MSLMMGGVSTRNVGHFKTPHTVISRKIYFKNVTFIIIAKLTPRVLNITY
jgi:hypothetical protein